MVNGMLIDTEDETKSKPMAISNGFRSGLARDMIFRNEDAVGGEWVNIPGRTLDNIEDLAGRSGGGLGPLEDGCVERAFEGIRKERTAD
jgi:hypothetical protein